MAQKKLQRAAVCLHDCVVPHERNNFKPFLFTLGGVVAVITLALLIQFAYIVQTRIVFKDTDFLASVLPGVLATLTNQDRERAGMAALTQDAHLAQAAQMKAEDMAARGYFAHVDPEGRQPWHWLDQAGYAYVYAGENLAVNFTDSADVQKAWMNSPTHHANIVKREYTRIGIGVARGTYKGNDTTFVVQFFATPRAAAAPAPIAREEVTPQAGAADTDEVATVSEDGTSTTGETEVLGVEVGTVPASTTGGEPVLDTAYVSEQEGQVQGMHTNASTQVQSFMAQVAASPTYTLIYILSAIAVVVSLFLLIAVIAHIKVAYLEVLGGGLLILLVILSLLIFNATSGTDVVLPEDAGSASAISAF